MIRAPGYREVREGVSDSDHREKAKHGCLYSTRRERRVMGLIKMLQFSLSLDNSLSAVSLHLAISFWDCALLSFSRSAHTHTHTHTHTYSYPTVYLYFPLSHNAISLHTLYPWYPKRISRGLNYRWLKQFKITHVCRLSQLILCNSWWECPKWTQMSF